MSANKTIELLGDWSATKVNANWGRNMLIASHILGKAAGISWHALECEEELTVIEALQSAMRSSEYNYEQLVAGLGLLASYLVWLDQDLERATTMAAVDDRAA
jgi:hypothetical protein